MSIIKTITTIIITTITLTIDTQAIQITNLIQKTIVHSLVAQTVRQTRTVRSIVGIIIINTSTSIQVPTTRIIITAITKTSSTTTITLADISFKENPKILNKN